MLFGLTFSGERIRSRSFIGHNNHFCWRDLPFTFLPLRAPWKPDGRSGRGTWPKKHNNVHTCFLSHPPFRHLPRSNRHSSAHKLSITVTTHHHPLDDHGLIGGVPPPWRVLDPSEFVPPLSCAPITKQWNGPKTTASSTALSGQALLCEPPATYSQFVLTIWSFLPNCVVIGIYNTKPLTRRDAIQQKIIPRSWALKTKLNQRGIISESDLRRNTLLHVVLWSILNILPAWK